MRINYNHVLFRVLRLVLQKIGLLRPIVRFYRQLFRVDYEENFEKEMLKIVNEGDVIWDVGANVGYFSEKFSNLTKENGYVVCFEPDNKTFSTLRENMDHIYNVECVNAALSDFDGLGSFESSSTVNDPTNKISNDASIGDKVLIMRGDTFAKNSTKIPNIVKIDVEGFELEVLHGMSALLAKTELRAVCIEIHFQELSNRKLFSAPDTICELLRRNGYSIIWVDPSHIIADKTSNR